ncbi:RVP domain-containing protein [Trichonephila clavipes]|nr:RVP domain-containing protein [Trichonephila clavipes]
MKHQENSSITEKDKEVSSVNELQQTLRSPCYQVRIYSKISRQRAERLIQISAENLQEELDLRHVENRQIKKELEKLIQDYKPEKTASTDVTMRIILKDEEPVCQHPRRLTFTERQEVNR